VHNWRFQHQPSTNNDYIQNNTQTSAQVMITTENTHTIAQMITIHTISQIMITKVNAHTNCTNDDYMETIQTQNCKNVDWKFNNTITTIIIHKQLQKLMITRIFIHTFAQMMITTITIHTQFNKC